MNRFWRLSIPIGETTDNPLVNPFGPYSQSLEAIDFDPILVVAGGSDLLKDRAEDYAKRLKEWGNKDIEYVEFEVLWKHWKSLQHRCVRRRLKAKGKRVYEMNEP